MIKFPIKSLILALYILGYLIICTSIYAQPLTQTIRGVVKDATNSTGLVGVTIQLLGKDIGTATDEQGTFRIEEVPVGRYTLEASYVGYRTAIVSELLLESGKEMVVDIQLESTNEELAEVIVKGHHPNGRRKVYPAHELLTIEETLRLPSTFFDPARLATFYAGVANPNDQANHLIVRGNSPNSNSWRLEGVEIVNPNHLSNGGTNTDLPAKNGGGVNILSAQMLGNTTFMRGSLPTEMGNVLSSVLDMSLRKGNNQQKEFTGQVGVIGVDLAAEGPLSKQHKGSYLANYRYSFLGILGAAGVDLGDEAINFQDLALTLHFPTDTNSEVTLFGFMGNSKNEFMSKPMEEVMIQKDLFNISFTSDMQAIGLKFDQILNGQWNFGITSVFSALDSFREFDRPSTIESGWDRTTTEKFSTHAFLQYQINARSGIRVGSVITYLHDLSRGDGGAGKADGTIWQPYVNGFFNWSNLSLEIGSRYLYFDFNKTASFEPTAQLQWSFENNHRLGVGYSKSSQRQLPEVYGFEDNFVVDNTLLELTKSHQFALWYEVIRNTVRYKVETYYQSLYDVPVAKNSSNSFSTLNLFEESIREALVNDGTGTNYGVELTAQQYFSNNSFWLANLSLYESTYKGSDGIERDTRFNGNYIVNAAYGREFPYSKKGKDMILGVNLHATLVGGLRETPIDAAASVLAQRTVFDTQAAFSLRQNTFFKTDLRIYWKRNRKKFSSTLALDIQNLTNQQNPSFQFYDTFLQEITQEYKLGLLPILSYRVEF